MRSICLAAFAVLALVPAGGAEDDVVALRKRIAKLEKDLTAARAANRRMAQALDRIIAELDRVRKDNAPAETKKIVLDRKARTDATRKLVREVLPRLIIAYRQKMRRAPVMTLAELRQIYGVKSGLAIAANTTNEPCEALLVMLQHPTFPQRGELADLPIRKPFGNTDNDRFDKNPPGVPTSKAMEILDAWGHPVVYIHNRAYDKPVRIVNAKGKVVEVRAQKRKDGTYHNAIRFQLISLGPNGIQDADDIVNFDR